jgi:hypothetical protein
VFINFETRDRRQIRHDAERHHRVGVSGRFRRLHATPDDSHEQCAQLVISPRTVDRAAHKGVDFRPRERVAIAFRAMMCWEKSRRSQRN